MKNMAIILLIMGSCSLFAQKKIVPDSLYQNKNSNDSFTRRHSQKEFEMSSDALHEYLFYKNNARTGLMLSVIGTALASTAMFTLNKRDGLSNGLIGGACVTLGTSLV